MVSYEVIAGYITNLLQRYGQHLDLYIKFKILNVFFKIHSFYGVWTPLELCRVPRLAGGGGGGVCSEDQRLDV